MIWSGQENAASNRLRAGLVILVLGVLLVLWAWGSWAYRLSAERSDARTTGAVLLEPSAEQLQAAGAMRLFLVVVLVLVVGVMFASYMALRMSRRYRDAAARSRSAPTTYQDAWSMHKLPEDHG